MMKWWKKNPEVHYTAVVLQGLWKALPIPKKNLLLVISVYCCVVTLSIGMTVYFQGEMKRISAEIDEEILTQEAETTFLHSESYQFVKQLDDNILDLDGVYHLVLSSIGDTPLVTVSTHKEDESIDVVVQGSTLDMVQWLVGMQKVHPTLRFRIEKIIHAQGVTTLQCKIYENTKK